MLWLKVETSYQGWSTEGIKTHEEKEGGTRVWPRDCVNILWWEVESEFCGEKLKVKMPVRMQNLNAEENLKVKTSFFLKTIFSKFISYGIRMCAHSLKVLTFEGWCAGPHDNKVPHLKSFDKRPKEDHMTIENENYVASFVVPWICSFFVNTPTHLSLESLVHVRIWPPGDQRKQ